MIYNMEYTLNLQLPLTTGLWRRLGYEYVMGEEFVSHRLTTLGALLPFMNDTLDASLHPTIHEVLSKRQ